MGGPAADPGDGALTEVGPKGPFPMTTPNHRRARRARRYVRNNYSLILLHALYQAWGLPTARLRPLFQPKHLRRRQGVDGTGFA
jgi:hypothetical protein